MKNKWIHFSIDRESLIGMLSGVGIVILSVMAEKSMDRWICWSLLQSPVIHLLQILDYPSVLTR